MAAGWISSLDHDVRNREFPRPVKEHRGWDYGTSLPVNMTLPT